MPFMERTGERAQADDRRRRTRARRGPRRGRHRPARPDVRGPRDDRGRRSAGRAPLPRPRAHRSRHRHHGARARTSCWPATSSRTEPCRSSATAIPLDWPATADAPGGAGRPGGGVVVPGHGDHAGRAFADAQAASFDVAGRARPTACVAGELDVAAALAAHPFPDHPAGGRPRRAPAGDRPGRGRRSADRARSVVEDERDEHVHAVGDDAAVLDIDLLLLDPRALDVAQRLVRALDALVDGGLEALGRSGR